MKSRRAYETKIVCQLCNKYYRASSLRRHHRIAHRGHFQGSKPPAEPLIRSPIESSIYEEPCWGGDCSALFSEEMSYTVTEIDNNSPFSMDLNTIQTHPVGTGDLAGYSHSIIIDDDAGIIENDNDLKFEERQIIDIEPQLPTGLSSWRTVCYEDVGKQFQVPTNVRKTAQ